MPGAFLYDDRSRSATITSAQATVATLPVGLLQDPQPRARARLVGSSAVLVLDLLASASVDVAALLSTTLTAGATVRVRLSTVDATGAAGDAWDSGVLPGATGPEVNGNVLVLRAAGPVTGRYLRWDITDGSLSVIDVGLAPCGALWRLARSHAFGIEEGRAILDRRDRNELTGAEFAVPAIANPRMARFALPLLSAVEAVGAHRDLVRQLGAARDALWIPELTLSRAEMNARSLWGAVNLPGQAASVARAALNVFQRSFAMVERL